MTQTSVGTRALEVSSLTKHFAKSRSLLDTLRKKSAYSVPAVDGVDLYLEQGETLGLVGESGCGKSTLGRTLVGLYKADAGEISLYGQSVAQGRTLEQRRLVQMIFQDPFSSLNPRMTVGDSISEGLLFHGLATRENVDEKVRALLTLVGLPADSAGSYPRQFSGGQRQRIGIARALALEPKLLVADEVVSALDVSVQASVINLLTDLKRDLGLSMLFISHNIAVVRQISDRIAVMYLGRIVEMGPTEEIFNNPSHPYTKLLLSSVPKMRTTGGLRSVANSELPSASTVFTGCRFKSRCSVAVDACSSTDPALVQVNGQHQAACLLLQK